MFIDQLNCSENEILSLIKEYDCSPKVGFEKETLRVINSGISQKKHPESLGSALCNKYITTDFSEAQTELVTPPFHDKIQGLKFLEDIHHFVSCNITDEILWPFSMPPPIDDDREITIANYGSSNLGLFKRRYRTGLSERYGSLMQTISGIHYNYSVPESIWESSLFKNTDINPNIIRSDAYFNMLRNIYRINWLILYLFGASPILTRNFVNEEEKGFNQLDNQTLYLPYATSLRMSNFGYQNTRRRKLEVSINSINEYVADLSNATKTIHPDFAKIHSTSTNFKAQINENVLQIDDEYYAIAR